MRKAIVILSLLSGLLLASQNYIALTFNPGANGVVMTYTYTLNMTLIGPLGFTFVTSTQSVVTVPNVPLSTTIEITETPTAIGTWTVNLGLEVTADNGVSVASTSTSTLMTFKAGAENTQTFTVSLPNGGSINGEVVLYIAGIPSPALLAAAAAALIGLRRKAKRN